MKTLGDLRAIGNESPGPGGLLSGPHGDDWFSRLGVTTVRPAYEVVGSWCDQLTNL